MTKIEIDGKSHDAEKEERWIVGKNEIQWSGKVRAVEMAYSLKPTETPKAIDMKITQGQSTGEKLIGIYTLDGDTLKVCYQILSEERPKAFQTKQGDSTKVLVTLKRMNKALDDGGVPKKGQKTGKVPPKADIDRLQGTWTAVSVERDGKLISDEEVTKLDLRLTITGDEFMWMPLASKGPEHFPHGRFNLDTTKKPKAIDLTISLPFSPSKKTSTILGIYEVDGDSLRILKGLPSEARPTEFRTPPQSGLEVITFKRAKG